MLSLKIPTLAELKTLETLAEIMEVEERFGISEKTFRHCRWQGDDKGVGVYVHNDGEGDSFLACELPLCQNGDVIQEGSIYVSSYDGDGYVKVKSMELVSGIHSWWRITWIDYDCNTEPIRERIEDGHIDNFVSIFW